jgi:hypothetical protein
VRLVGSFRLSRRGVAGDGGRALRAALGKYVPPEAKTHLYEVADKFGNVRINRIAFASTQDPQAKTEARFYLRVTGKWDRERVLSAIREKHADVKLEQPEGGRGRVTLVHFPATERGPGLAIVGSTDLLVGVFERRGPRVDNEEIVTQMLLIRAGREKSVLEGSLAKDLKVVVARSGGFVVGRLPPDLRANLTQGKGAFRALPEAFFLKVRQAKGLTQIRLEADLGSAAEARRFAEDVARMKGKMRGGLDKIPEEVRRKLPPGGAVALRKMVASLDARATGKMVRGGVDVSPEAARVMVELGGLYFTLRQPPEPEPKPARVEPAK